KITGAGRGSEFDALQFGEAQQIGQVFMAADETVTVVGDDRVDAAGVDVGEHPVPLFAFAVGLPRGFVGVGVDVDDFPAEAGGEVAADAFLVVGFRGVTYCGDADAAVDPRLDRGSGHHRKR